MSRFESTTTVPLQHFRELFYDISFYWVDLPLLDEAAGIIGTFRRFFFDKGIGDPCYRAITAVYFITEIRLYKEKWDYYVLLYDCNGIITWANGCIDVNCLQTGSRFLSKELKPFRNNYVTPNQFKARNLYWVVEHRGLQVRQKERD